MENSELDKRIAEVWKRVSGEDLPPAPPPMPEMRESSVETVRFLKDNYGKAQAEWERLLSAKELNVRDLSFQLEETRAHLAELKQHYTEAREKLVTEQLNTALNLEETRKALRGQKDAHQREVRLLQEVLERGKNELRELGARVEALTRERDEYRRKYGEANAGSADLRDAAAALEKRLADAKAAVEATLSELLVERKERAEANRRIKELERKNSEMADELSAARAAWDAERTQWKELWERERSVWETHRQEFAVWEERLRSERQAWLEKLRGEEEKGLGYAEGLSRVLKDSSEWSQKVTQVLQLYALKGVELPKVFVSTPFGAVERPRGLRRAFMMAGAALVLLAGTAFYIHDYRSRPRFELLQSWPLDLKGVSYVAGSEEGLWLADWEQGLVLKDRKDMATLRRIDGNAGVPLRAAAAAPVPGSVWALDLAQLRLVRKETVSGRELGGVRTPGPAPQGLAHDGHSLWSFDAASGLFYRHGPDPAHGALASYEIKGVKTVKAMQWAGGKFWVLDGSGALGIYDFTHGGFKKVSGADLGPGAEGFWLDGKEFWTLEKARDSSRLELRKSAVRSL
ncbi:MAG TPA: hypothetical protein PK523_00750 [Elusimicrobiales bacterium]|nr:hypothetical protein [Elusimicrobiales bacterium]